MNDEILLHTPELPKLLRLDVPLLRACVQEHREKELEARNAADHFVNKLSEINDLETKFFMKALAEDESVKLKIERTQKELREIQKWQVSRKRRVLRVHLPHVKAARQKVNFSDRVSKRTKTATLQRKLWMPQKPIYFARNAVK